MARYKTVLAVLIAVASALAGVPHFLEVLTDILKKVNTNLKEEANPLDNIKISKTGLQHASRILEELIVDNWKESVGGRKKGLLAKNLNYTYGRKF